LVHDTEEHIHVFVIAVQFDAYGCKGGFTHSMPRPCRSPAMPCVNSHMPCRAPALLRRCRVLHESPRGSRKYPNS